MASLVGKYCSAVLLVCSGLADGKTKFTPDGLIKQRSPLTPSANNTLIYKAAYVGTGDTVVAGEFSAVVNMSLRIILNNRMEAVNYPLSH